MPLMKPLVELSHCLKQLAILRRRFAVQSGESWYILLLPHNLKTFLKDKKVRKSCTCYSMSLRMSLT